MGEEKTIEKLQKKWDKKWSRRKRVARRSPWGQGDRKKPLDKELM